MVGGFPSEPWPLKPPCPAELGRVVGGTEISCLDSCFVFFIYSLVPFRAGVFSLKEFFLLVYFTGFGGGKKKISDFESILIGNNTS